MQPTFTSGGPGTVRRLGRWARRYQLPLLLTGAFMAMLATMVVLSAGRTRTQAGISSPTPAVEAPRHSPCPACGIGERCDKETGACELEQLTPPPCVKGAHYDADAGYCVPDPTPKPTRVPSKTLEPGPTLFTFPPTAAPPRTPRFDPEPTPDITRAPSRTPRSSP